MALLELPNGGGHRDLVAEVTDPLKTVHEATQHLTNAMAEAQREALGPDAVKLVKLSMKLVVPGWIKLSFEAFSGNIWLIVTGGKTLRLEMLQLSKKLRRKQRFPAKWLNRITAGPASMMLRLPEPSGRQ